MASHPYILDVLRYGDTRELTIRAPKSDKVSRLWFTTNAEFQGFVTELVDKAFPGQEKAA